MNATSIVPETVLTLKKRRREAKVNAQRVRFSAHKCFNGPPCDAVDKILNRLALWLVNDDDLAVCGTEPMQKALIQRQPNLRGRFFGLEDIQNREDCRVFLAEPRYVERLMLRQRLPKDTEVIDLDIVQDIALDLIPDHAWISDISDSIYPIHLP